MFAKLSLAVFALSCSLSLGGSNFLWSQEGAPPAGDKAAGDKAAEDQTQSAKKQKKDAQKKDANEWTSLIPEKGLGDWIVTDFGTEGEVKRVGESLLLEMGDPLTGINRKKLGDFPKNNYEIELECKRVDGNDFLCGLTFPVGDEFCSFIAGGWGGGLVGLSSINGMDASENSTSSYRGFDNGKWYQFRIRVDDEYVRAWIDEKETIRQEREHTEFSTRIEVYPSQPLGLCVFQSTVEVRDFKWRALPQKDSKDEAEEGDSPRKNEAGNEDGKKDH